MDPRALRQIFGLFATGVTVVTARHGDDDPVAITANSFTSVSIDPPLVLWCLDKRSRHIPAFAREARFAIHVLKRDQAEVALHHARSIAPATVSPSGGEAPPVVEDALARIECRVFDCHAAGDHIIIVGKVDGIEQADGAPLVFHASQFGGFAPSP